MQLSRHIAIYLGSALLAACALASPPAVGYHLVKKLPLGGGSQQEYFDYITVDASARRVYLTHGTQLDIVDADTGNKMGEIDGLHQIHGVALVPELGKGFISEGGANQVSVFDLKTLKVTGQIKTGGNPDCIIYDTASKRIFTFNGATKDSTVIEPATGSVVATIDMGGRPEYAVADGKGMIYDNIEDMNEVAALDARTLTIKARWPLAPAGTPTAMGMDRQHRRLFIGGRNKVLAIMDADKGNIVQTFPIGDGVDANIYQPETGLLFTSTREGTIHIFHEDSPNNFVVVETVKTEYGAKTMALDSKTRNIYVDTVDYGPAPAPTTQQPNPLPAPLAGTFRVLVYAR
jgi:DNA-binding beta-propeller fold protein YncE